MRLRIFLEQNKALLAGDVLAIAVVTAAGFATHGTLGTAGTRMLTTFLPALLAWFLIAPYLGVYRPENTLEWRQLWRPFWAMILAAPLAAWLRGVMLGNAAIQPVFVAVMGLFSALGMLTWRSLYLVGKRSRQNRSQFKQGPQQHG